MLRIPVIQAAIDAIYFTCPEKRLFTSLVRPLVDPKRGHYSCSLITSTCSEKQKVDQYTRSSFVCAAGRLTQSLCSTENLVFAKRGKKTMPLSPPLTADQRETLVKPLLAEKGWKMDENGRDAIKKEFVFKDFIQAWSFMSMVAIKAEKLNHHPEWSNVYNRVSILFSSHDVNGLSERDLKMAKFADDAFNSIKQ